MARSGGGGVVPLVVGAPAAVQVLAGEGVGSPAGRGAAASMVGGPRRCRVSMRAAPGTGRRGAEWGRPVSSGSARAPAVVVGVVFRGLRPSPVGDEGGLLFPPCGEEKLAGIKGRLHVAAPARYFHLPVSGWVGWIVDVDGGACLGSHPADAAAVFPNEGPSIGGGEHPKDLALLAAGRVGEGVGARGSGRLGGTGGRGAVAVTTGGGRTGG